MSDFVKWAAKFVDGAARPKITEVDPLNPDRDPVTGEPRNVLYTKVQGMSDAQRKEQVFIPTKSPSLFGSRIPTDVPYGQNLTSDADVPFYLSAFDDAEGDTEETPAWGVPRFAEGLLERGVGTAQTLAAIPEGVAGATKKLVTGEAPLYIKAEERKAKDLPWTESVWEGVKRIPDEVVELGAGMLQLGDAATRYDPEYTREGTAERIAEGVSQLPGALVGSAVETVTNPVGTWQNAPVTGLLDVSMLGGAGKALAQKGGDLAVKGLQATAAPLRAVEVTRKGKLAEATREVDDINAAIEQTKGKLAERKQLERAVEDELLDPLVPVGSPEYVQTAEKLEPLRDPRLRRRDANTKRSETLERGDFDPGAPPIDESITAANRARDAAEAAVMRAETAGGEALTAAKGREAALSRPGRGEAVATTAANVLERTADFVDGAVRPIQSQRARQAKLLAERQGILDEAAPDVGAAIVAEDAARVAAATPGDVLRAKGTEWREAAIDATSFPDDALAAERAAKAVEDIEGIRLGDTPEIADNLAAAAAAKARSEAMRIGDKTVVDALKANDRVLRKNSFYVKGLETLSKIPTYYVTLGSGAVVDAGLWALQQLTKKASPGVGPASLRRWLFEARNNRLPQEFLDAEYKLQKASRERELQRAEAAAPIPKDKTQAVADILTEKPTTVVDDLAPVDEGGFRVVAWTPGYSNLGTYESLGPSHPFGFAASPEALASTEKVLAVAQKYATPVRSQIAKVESRANSLGGIDPDFYKNLRASKTLDDVAQVVNREDMRLTSKEMYKAILDDPALSMDRQLFEGRKALLSQTNKEEGRAFARKYVLVPENERLMPALKGKYVDSDVVTELRNQAALLESINANPTFHKGFSLYKAGKTAGSLPTHAKNLLTSALIMAPAAGINILNPVNARFYSRALADLTQRGMTRSYRMAVVDGVMDAGYKADVGSIATAGEKVVRPLELMTGILDLAFKPAPKKLLQATDDQIRNEAIRLAGPGATPDAIAESVAQIKKTLAAENQWAKVNEAGGLIKSTFKMPVELYGVEDNLFRLALYYKLLSKAQAAEGVASIYKVSEAARKAAALEAQRAFVSYGNIPGAGQVLRSPHAPVSATGKVYGNKSLFWAAAQPFVSYPLMATPIVKKYLREKPGQARATLALHDYFTDQAYEGTGRTKEQDVATLRASGQRGTMPARAMGLGSMESPGTVLGLDLGFLQPAGKFAPDLSREATPGSVQTGFDYLNDALNLGGPGLVQAVTGAIRDQDIFSGRRIREGQNDWENIKQTGKYLAQQVLPPSTPGIGTQWDKLMREPNYMGKTQTEEEAYLSVLGGINAGSTTPADAAANVVQRTMAPLLLGDYSDLNAIMGGGDTVYYKEYRGQPQEVQVKLATQWLERNKPTFARLQETLAELPWSPEKADIEEQLIYGAYEPDPEEALKHFRQALGLAGQQRRVTSEQIKRTADEQAR